MTTITKLSLLTSDSPNWNSLVGNPIAQEGAGGELITDGDYYREYNALHQLTKIMKKTATGKIIEEYSYGPDGERIMTVNYLTNTTIYTPFREWMMIVNRTGTYNYTYVYDGNTLVAKINPDGTKWFYHDDHLGSTSLITDESGNIVEETFYNPFGQVTSGGEREAYLLYTNQMKDAIGCYDYGARVYCPEWYHFTSGDPITANVFDPQGLNRFAYVRNNPYKYVDPDGRNGINLLDFFLGIGEFYIKVDASKQVFGSSNPQETTQEIKTSYGGTIYKTDFDPYDEGQAPSSAEDMLNMFTHPAYIIINYDEIIYDPSDKDVVPDPKKAQLEEVEDATSPQNTYEQFGEQSTPNEQTINVDGASDPGITVPSTPVEQTDKQEKAAKGLLSVESDPDDSWKVVMGRRSSNDDKDSSTSSTTTGDGGSGSKYHKTEKKGKRGGR